MVNSLHACIPVLQIQFCWGERDTSAEETAEGVYLSWRSNGTMLIRAQKTAGANAVISGVFVDHP